MIKNFHCLVKIIVKLKVKVKIERTGEKNNKALILACYFYSQINGIKLIETDIVKSIQKVNFEV